MTSRSYPSETDLVKAILLALSQRGDLMVWRNNTGALLDEHRRLVRFGLPGSPDIIGWARGFSPAPFFGLEVKTPTGRQSPQQRKFQSRAVADGAFYAVVRSVDEALAAADQFVTACQRAYVATSEVRHA